MVNKIVAFTVFLLLLATACASESVQKDPIIVGGLYTLSGEYAGFLRGSANGVRLAVEDFQDETGITVRLVEEDDKSCTDKISPANKLINVDQVRAILGTTCSSMTLSVAPIAEEAKVLLVSGSSTSEEISDAGDYVFRTIGSDAAKSEKVADEIKAEGFTRVGIIYGDGNDAATTALRAIGEALKQSSTRIALAAPVSDKETDFRTVLLKMDKAMPDVLILIITSPKQYGLILSQRDQLGLEKISVYGVLDTIENPEVVMMGGESVEGILYPSFSEPSGPEYEMFKKRYMDEYGELPPARAAESYDAAMITLKALARSDGTAEDARKQMFAVGKEYPGVSGTITFDENGDVDVDLEMKTIRDGAFQRMSD